MNNITRPTRQPFVRGIFFVVVLSLPFVAMILSPLVQGQNSPVPSGTEDRRPLREAELIAQGRPLPDYDVRSLWAVPVDSSKAKAAQALQKQTGANVLFDSASGGVSHIFREGGYLTEQQSGTPLSNVRNFIAENPAMFGLSQSELSNFKSVAENQDGATGVTHVYLQEQINGLHVFGSSIKGHVDKEGRLISIEGNYYPNVAFPDQAQTISAKDALLAALQSSLPDLLAKVTANQNPVQPSGEGGILAAGPAYQFPTVIEPESGVDKLTLFDKGIFANPIRVREVIFPMANGARLAWEVDVQAFTHQASYVILVDANNGELLYRTNTVRFISNSKASVFLNNPDATPLSTQNYFGDGNFSPLFWSTGQATMGNNVQSDSATSTGDFIFPFTDAWKTVGLNNFDLAATRL